MEFISLKEKYDIDFLIVTATNVELEKSLEYLQPFENEILKTYSGDNTFYCGLYGLYSCAIVKTNQMGAMLSGAAFQTTSESIEAIVPKAVIMGGIALGQSSKKQKLGDILVSKSIILYEQARVNEGGEVHYRGPKPEASRFLINRLTQETLHHYTFNDGEKTSNVLSGPILTGEKLIDDSVFKTALFKQFPDAIGGEMEAAGIYTACHQKNIPWIIVKSICDWADGEKDKTFQEESAHIVFSFINNALNSLIGFKEKNIHPYILKKKDSPEINLNADDILKLLVSRKNIQELQASKVERRISSKKIYYEYYQYTDRGRVEGFLFLGKNITITNTLDNYIHSFDKPDILNIYLTKKYNNDTLVDRISHLNKEIKKKLLNKIVFDGLKYVDEIVWDATLKGSDELNYNMRSDYVDQSVYSYLDPTNTVLGHSTSYFTEKLTDNGKSSISIIFGSGGVGKTTFCYALKNEFDTSLKDSRKKVLLIKGERTTKLNNFNELHIESLMDLFKAFKDEGDFPDIDAEDFQLNYACGNIIVIIDGIDEIDSALGERFNLKSFFESLSTLDERFYNTNLILTTRDYFERSIENRNVTFSKYKLNGFTKTDIDKFIDIKLKDRVQKRDFHTLLEKNSDDNNNYSLPMIVNWACEAALLSSTSTDSIEALKSDYLLGTDDYDRILATLLDREIDKQSINGTVDGIFKLFIEIVIIHKNKISISDLEEYISFEFYENVDKFLKNPLLLVNKTHVCIKEDALCSLIKARQLRYLMLNRPELIEHIADLLKDAYEGKGELFRALIGTIDTKESNFIDICKKLIASFITKENTLVKLIDKIKYQKSISALLYMAFKHQTNLDKSERTNLLTKLFNSSSELKLLKGVHIFGSFYSLDFTEVNVMNSSFNSYEKFDDCSFFAKGQPSFSYCWFNNVNIERMCDLNETIFDNTCKFRNSNILEKLKPIDNKKDSLKHSIKQNIISIARYVDSSNKALIYIKSNTQIKWSSGYEDFIDILVEHKFLSFDNKGLYRIAPKYFDDMPDLKLSKIYPNTNINKLIVKLTGIYKG